MKIIIPKLIAAKIYNQVIKYSPNETKGALFAKKISNELFEIDDIYIEKNVGSFAFVTLINNKKYQKFQKTYHEKNNNDYVRHNYIGDWHSHPSFELNPSSFDIKEVKEDLKASNAKFLIQIIVKAENENLIGNAFYFNRKVFAKKIDLIIL